MTKTKYRVLVADDEYWSRENLRNLIDWDALGLDFLEPAEDGQEVLERIPTETPNILLSDINMPFLDGISLFREVQTKYPQMVSIAVSGYDGVCGFALRLFCGRRNGLSVETGGAGAIEVRVKQGYRSAGDEHQEAGGT